MSVIPTELIDVDITRDEARRYKPRPPSSPVHPPRPSFQDVDAAERRKVYSKYYRGMDAYTRHKMWVSCYGKRTTPQDDKVVSSSEVNHFQFIRDKGEKVNTWEQQVAKEYWDKLYKEYVLVDLSRYKKQIGMRWRIEREVVDGKGQFVCGNVECSNAENLVSYEVVFAYEEGGESKTALVKARLCTDCAPKLGYKKAKRKRRKEKKSERKKRKSEKKEEATDNVWERAGEKVRDRTDDFGDYFEGLFP